jgi:hypothetical protein
LKEEHFTTAAAKQEFRELLLKAEQLRGKAKKPAAGQPKPTFAALKGLQADVNKERGDLLNENYIGKCVFLNAGCFAAGTKLWTPQGYRAIEDIKAGERVYSRDQWDEGGEIVAKIVEEVFERYSVVWDIVADGRTIRTTSEHPFMVRGKGWTLAHELRVGDRLVCAETGRTVTVEAIRDTGERELVYNLRVADFHTYFVGGDEWGWAAWAHNAYTLVSDRKTGRVFEFTETGYSAQWFVPKKAKFLTTASNPNKVVKNGVATDVQSGAGNQLQAVVTQFAADWDQLAWDDAEKTTAGRRDAIERALDGTEGVNPIYQLLGWATVGYQVFMEGASLPRIPSVKPAGLTLTDAEYVALKDTHKKALLLAYKQRAASKGDYVHGEVKVWASAPLHGFRYQGHGVDLKHLATGEEYEVMVVGTWDQHSAGDFERTYWRAITFNTFVDP